jgi:hypothetical protein
MGVASEAPDFKKPDRQDLNLVRVRILATS